MTGSYANLERSVWKADTWLGILAREHAKAAARKKGERRKKYRKRTQKTTFKN
jgi:hypothetical protein